MQSPRVRPGSGLPAVPRIAALRGQGGARLPAWRARINSPNLMWPADDAWFVATEIDNAWTGIGGSAAQAAELLEQPDLDVRRLDPTTWRPED